MKQSKQLEKNNYQKLEFWGEVDEEAIWVLGNFWSNKVMIYGFDKQALVILGYRKREWQMVSQYGITSEKCKKNMDVYIGW